jgi:hypothetical protein
MSKLVTLFLLLLLPITLLAQKCNCRREMKFLEDKVEHNLPSYQDQVVSQKRDALYLEHKKNCNTIADSITDSAQCIYLTAKYLSFFRDEHLAVNYKENLHTFDESDAEATSKFYAKERKYNMPPPSKKLKGPEGFWRTKDNKMVVRVVKNASPLWDYAGFIISGDKKYWSRGQLKFSLKQLDKNKYESIYLTATRRPRVVTAIFKDTSLSFGRMTEFKRIADPDNLPAPVKSKSLSSEFEFSELSDQTNYLHIPDLSHDLYPFIDSFVAANRDNIITKPNLIIDIRENGGGSDRSFQALIPLIMSSKIFVDPIAASIFASADVQTFYKENIYKYCSSRADTLSADSLLAQLRQYNNKFTLAKFEDHNLDTFFQYPLRVAILMDRWCASSTEGFILNIKQSDKVLLCGENTWGMCTYGELREVPMPCLPIVIDMPCKKMLMRDGADYESTGIAPQLRLDDQPKDEWIKLTQQRLEHK